LKQKTRELKQTGRNTVVYHGGLLGSRTHHYFFSSISWPLGFTSLLTLSFEG